jgi:hypothetical protein
MTTLIWGYISGCSYLQCSHSQNADIIFRYSYVHYIFTDHIQAVIVVIIRILGNVHFRPILVF